MGFTVTFWGVRGTVPCPLASHIGYGGNTPCVEVRAGEQIIIIDAGTGIRPLGHALLQNGERDLTLLLSHCHLDHINGFPFFAPAYQPDCKIRVIAAHPGAGRTTQAILARQMEEPLFPVPLHTMGARFTFTDIAPGDGLTLAPDLVLRTAALNHPNGAVGYRIEHAGKVMAYITDTEHRPGQTDANVLALAQDADLLLYDSTYTEEEWQHHIGWGHSTPTEGVRIAQIAGVRQYALFHHDPNHDDTMMAAIEAEARSVFPDSFAAREGMTITLA